MKNVEKNMNSESDFFCYIHTRNNRCTHRKKAFGGSMTNPAVFST